MPTFGAVESQYDVFPYPKPTVVARQLPEGFVQGTLSFLTLRRAEDWFPRNLRIWVAGCGTQQAAMWALSHPEAEIVATDLSDTVLGIARSIIDQLNIENVRFERQNIAEATFEAEFDLVVSTGVIHHMPDPVVGATAIRRAMKPTGAAMLMVYNDMHRAALGPFRRAHRLLCNDEEEAEARYAFASRMLDATIASPRCMPLAGSALEKLRAVRESDPAYVADALLHPLEHAYDVTGVLELLDAAGLRHTSWTNPAAWDLDRYVDDPDLLERAKKLDDADRWKIVHALAGRNSPLLELIAEPSDTPKRTPFTLDEILSMRVVRDHGVEGFALEEGKVTKSGFIPGYQVDDEKVFGRAQVAYGPGREWQLPLAGREVIDAFEEPRSIGEVLDELGPRFGRNPLLELIGHLLPCDIGALAPIELPA